MESVWFHVKIMRSPYYRSSLIADTNGSLWVTSWSQASEIFALPRRFSLRLCGHASSPEDSVKMTAFWGYFRFCLLQNTLDVLLLGGGGNHNTAATHSFCLCCIPTSKSKRWMDSIKAIQSKGLSLLSFSWPHFISVNQPERLCCTSRLLFQTFSACLSIEPPLFVFTPGYTVF